MQYFYAVRRTLATSSTKEGNVMSLSLTNGNLFINSIKLSKIPEVHSFEECQCDNMEKPIITKSSLSFHLETEPVNLSAIQEIAKNEYATNFKVTMMIPDGTRQKRRHKKRRINKKWLKKYGYETTYVELDIPKCHIKRGEDDCHFELECMQANAPGGEIYDKSR